MSHDVFLVPLLAQRQLLFLPAAGMPTHLAFCCGSELAAFALMLTKLPQYALASKGYAVSMNTSLLHLTMLVHKCVKVKSACQRFNGMQGS